MSTIVGTNIEVTNLKYDSDTTSMIISNAGQVTIQGEGTATTNLQQGLAKCWVQFQGSASAAAARDSFNQSSNTDLGTGNYQININNDMASTDYAVLALAQYSNNNGQTIAEGPSDPATGSYELYTKSNDNSVYDSLYVSTAIFGDLA